MEEKEIEQIFNGGGQFPRFQWSIFSGASREQQFVVRSNDIEEFEENRKKVLELVDFGPGRPEPGKTKICNECGKMRTLREGATNNKPWKGWFCETKECKPEWVPTK